MRQFIEITTEGEAIRTAINKSPKALFNVRVENWPQLMVGVAISSGNIPSNNQLRVQLMLENYPRETPPLSLLDNGKVCLLAPFLQKTLTDESAIVTRRWFEPARRESWKVIPIPEDHKTILNYSRTFTEQEFKRLQLGDVPFSMDDHWFVFYEDEWLYLHRSWTGLGVFALHIVQTENGYAVTEVWHDAIVFPEYQNLDSFLNGMCSEAKIFDR